MSNIDDIGDVEAGREHIQMRDAQTHQNPQVTVAQVDPTQIVLNDLGYTIKDKKILQNISAVFQPGRVSVLVGPSGSGKTSLLSLIAGVGGTAPNASKVSGEVLYNGGRLSSDKIKKIVGFVFQDDVILETMTVQEAIKMSVELRVNRDSTAKNALGKRMLDISQLNKAKDVMIGSSANKGISGGERKRTAIAMELVSNPSVLLLDEPTSGLDSYTAFRIMSLLRRLAHRYGRTVITTLHQPSSEIFHLIDDLFVLHDGKLVYGGEAQQVVPYFTEAGYTFPMYSNPLDVLFMDILNRASEDEFAEEHVNKNVDGIPTDQLAEYFKGSNIFKTGTMEVIIFNQGITKEMHRFRAKQFHAFRLLLIRDMKNAIRNPMIIKTKLFQTTFLAIFIAAVFWNTKNATGPALFQNLSGVIFFLVINSFFASFQNVIPIFGAEKPSFAREHSQGYYSTMSYFLAKIIVELPLTVMFPILTSVITYWSLGLRSGIGHFFLFTFILQMVALSGFSLGLFAACIFDNVAIALALSILFILPVMIFGGLFLNVATVPVFLRWLQWISPMKYGYTAAMMNQFSGWEKEGAQTYYQNIGIRNGFSLFMNLVLLGILFGVGLVISYLALVRGVYMKENGSLLKRKRV